MVKFLRSTAAKIVLTGGIIAGLAVLADKANLGTRISQAAFATGQAGGSVITQPIAGLTNTLTGGINDIRLEAQKLFSGLNTAGADFQEAFTGNRDAIGDFFGGGQESEIKKDVKKVPDKFILNVEALKGKISGAPSSKKGTIRVGGTPKVGQPLIDLGFLKAPTTEAGRQDALAKLIQQSAQKFPQFFK